MRLFRKHAWRLKAAIDRLRYGPLSCMKFADYMIYERVGRFVGMTDFEIFADLRKRYGESAESIASDVQQYMLSYRSANA